MPGEEVSMAQIIPVFLCVFIVAGVLGAKEADLARGIQAYTEADYRTAITVLENLDESELRADERVVLHKFLALSLIARKQQERAQEEFIKLLTIEPGYELNNQDFSPSVRDLFQKSKIAQGARLCDRGVGAYNAGQFREAVPDLELALQLNPHDIRANEFLKLATNRLKEEDIESKKKEENRVKCVSSRAWGELDAKSATCQGRDYSSSLKLPAQANRVTLIYSKHYFGVGKCWKIVLYDTEGKEVLVLDDPSQAFIGKETPGNEARWRVVDLPEIRTIARVKMYGQGGHVLEKRVGPTMGRDLEDEFILGLEVACPEEAPAP
jgi:tetratricopeptide (TPR) repeat protein